MLFPPSLCIVLWSERGGTLQDPTGTADSPASRTLQRRMECVKFEPGVLTAVFDFLKLKVDGQTDLERECVLSLDEIAITPSMELHMLTGKLCQVTQEQQHMVVFMLAGNTTRWKQVVAYHYSGNSTNGVQANNYLSHKKGSIHTATCA